MAHEGEAMNALVIEDMETDRELAEFMIDERGGPRISVFDEQARLEIETLLKGIYLSADKIFFSESRITEAGDQEVKTLARKPVSNEERLIAMWGALAGSGQTIGGSQIRAYIKEDLK